MKISSWIKNWKKQRDDLILAGVEGSKPFYGRWFKRRSVAWDVSKRELLNMPNGCLGRELGRFLEREQLDLMPKFEEHDIMHVLLEYPTTVADEVRMQCFLLGNGKRSAYAILATVVGFLLIPEKIKSFIAAWRRGQQSLPCYKWDFRYLLKEPLLVLQNQLRRKTLGEEAPIYY